MKATAERLETRPKLIIGWLVASDLRDPELLEIYARARSLLTEQLREQFPMFDWRMPQIERRNFAPRGSLKPLNLLEMGSEERLFQRWDYALVVVPNELQPRRRISALGVPSSALEVAALSSARLGRKDEDLAERLAALAQHLLGHLFTLETRDEGPMRPPGEVEDLRLYPFPKDQEEELISILSYVTDTRLEERKRSWNTVNFYIRSFFSDWWGILKSIGGYRPWRIPLFLGRLTATVAVSLLLLLLTAESWEAGTHMRTLWLGVGSVAAMITACLFIFFGQHLDQVGRGRGWSEQLARSRIVLFGTLLAGMMSLWVMLFAAILTFSFLLPASVTSGWTGFDPADLPRARYAAFLASIGILVAALGGNLEEEDAIKAELFFDQEV
ncbi:MAG: hypothetical protein OXC09_01490 [Truepera sp.]|nr:hypothetical protein [Truepera sp.]